jgi:hypothetical protein
VAGWTLHRSKLTDRNNGHPLPSLNPTELRTRRPRAFAPRVSFPAPVHRPVPPPRGNHSTHPTTIQSSFSTVRCKTLTFSLITCYSSSVSACTESRSAAMRTRQPSDFFRSSIPTRPNCSPRTDINPLECALAGKHRVLPVFNRNPSHSNPLDATLMRVLLSVDSKRLREKLNPLDATLTKNQGEGAGFLGVQIFSRFSPVPLQATVFGATIRHGYEKSRQPRETNFPAPVSKNSERTSGTARSGSRLQVVPGFSVQMLNRLAGWLAFQRRVGKAGSVRLG